MWNQASVQKGIFMSFNTNNQNLKQYTLNNKAPLWKYDPLSLVFGKNELTLRFNKGEAKNTCSLSIVDKKDSIFNEKQANLN